MHSHQGRQFESRLFQTLCEKLEIAKTRTTPYRPSSNGQVERVNRMLLQSIQCYLDGKQQRWDEYLPLIAMSIQATENRFTGFTPNMMMLGREVNTPLEIITGVARVNSAEQDPPTMCEICGNGWWMSTRQNLKKAQSRQKHTYEEKLFCQTYQTGDLVYKLDTQIKAALSKKLKPIYTGPLIVVETLSPVTYRVEGHKKTEVLHHNRLRPCKESPVPLWVKCRRL